MGVGSAKKSPSKEGKTPIATRNSASKAIKAQTMQTPETPSRPGRGRSAREAYSHHLPTASERRNNGRVAGRSLIVWGRPRMAEKLLLHLHFECARHKIPVPWDAIAHRLHPGSSGAAILQHINRLRKELIGEGHLVPPVAQRPGSGDTGSTEVRGYIREDMDGDDLRTTRPVRFDEEIEDRRFNLPSFYNFEEANTADDQDEKEIEEEQWPLSPTPMSRTHSRAQSRTHNHTQSRTHQRINSVGQHSAKSSRPGSSMGMIMNQPLNSHESMQTLLMSEEDLSPSGSSPEDVAAQQETFTSPAARHQRKYSDLMVNAPTSPYPRITLPHHDLDSSVKMDADVKPLLVPQQSIFEGNVVPWAFPNDAVALDPAQPVQQPIMNSYGFSLPSNYPPLQYPSHTPVNVNAAVSMTQQSSQDSVASSFEFDDCLPQPMEHQKSSLSTMSSVDDAQCSSQEHEDSSNNATIAATSRLEGILDDNDQLANLFATHNEEALLLTLQAQQQSQQLSQSV